MKKLFLFVLLMGFLTSGWVEAGPSLEGTQLPARSTLALKKTMAKFGTMIASIEILHAKEPTPDWEAIELTIQEMSAALAEMQKSDVKKAYQQFTNVLESSLKGIQTKVQSKDGTYYENVEQLSNTCFQCHAIYRPSDFPVNRPKSVSQHQ